MTGTSIRPTRPAPGVPDIGTNVADTRALPIDADAMEKILYTNAAKLFRVGSFAR